jgi:hypothetical protein
MNAVTTILGLVIIAGIGFIINSLKGQGNLSSLKEEVQNLKFELSKKEQEVGELKQIQQENIELKEKGRNIFAQMTEIKEKNNAVTEKNHELTKTLSKHEEEKSRKEAEFDKKINKLEQAEKALEDERNRVRREDEARLLEQEQQRDRIWAEHEVHVINILSDLCKSPEYGFSTFDNNNLPEGFSGTLKPDFMIEFLEQYVIFDAKVSKADNLQTYINTQVKSTVKKVESNKSIYPTIFFVVPTDAIRQLKQTHFYEKGYAFYVVTPEALAPILASLKKISNYEFAEQLSPQDRDGIVNIIAEFDHHINFRNAYELVLTQMGVNVLKKAENLNEDIQKEVAFKKGKMRLETPTPTQLKQLMMEREAQQEKIEKFVSPKAAVPNKIKS